MERKKVLAKAGVLITLMNEKDLCVRRVSRGPDGKERSTALFINSEGLYDAAVRAVIKPGPVSVPWTEYYQEQARLGDLRVVEETKDAPRGTGASKHSGESRRAGGDA